MSADARRQNRVQNWEAKMADIDRRRREYNAQAGMSPVQGAIAFMPAEGLKFGSKPEVDVPEYLEPMQVKNTSFSSKSPIISGTPQSLPGFSNSPTSNAQLSQYPPITQYRYNKKFYPYKQGF
jgi:hypothetical protein